METETLSWWQEHMAEILFERARICARERQVPFILASILTLGAVSVAVGKGISVRSGSDRLTRANLFLLLGVPSGIGKSVVFADLMGPILDFESGLHDWWRREATPRARAGDEIFKGVVSGLRASVRRGSGTSLETFRRVQDSERKRGICVDFLEPPSLLTDDATPEAIVELMARSHEAIAVVSPDARAFLRRLATQDSKIESLFLKAFSGDLSLTHRISRSARRLRSPCLTSVLLTQTDAYRQFLARISETGSGLLPRFLHREIGFSGSLERTGGGGAKTKVKAKYARLLQGLIESFRFSEDHQVVVPSSEAVRFMAGRENALRFDESSRESLAAEILRRRTEQAWRLAVNLHCARHGKESARAPLSLQDAQSAMAIVEFLTEYESSSV